MPIFSIVIVTKITVPSLLPLWNIVYVINDTLRQDFAKNLGTSEQQ
jgi:hypothetical protein